MLKLTPTSAAVGSALLLIGFSVGVWFLLKDGAPDVRGEIVRPSLLSGGESYNGAPLDADYKNETFRFALDMPDGFSVGELPPDENGGTAIILQNKKGEGIQIYITPTDREAKILTAEDVRTSLPGTEVKDSQVVTIGNDHQGIAFLSDNPAFDGSSREVWFYFRGNLYQISTYERLDTLLQAMFATWTFF
jgi:hypothetical protein